MLVYKKERVYRYRYTPSLKYNNPRGAFTFASRAHKRDVRRNNRDRCVTGR